MADMKRTAFFVDFLYCFGYDWNMQVEVASEETAVLIR